MNIGKLADINRRTFLQRAAYLSVAGTASSYALGLAGVGEAAALTAEDGYKALVCIFLYGGNDHANTLIPADGPNHARYAAIRNSIAIQRDRLGATILRQPQDQILTDDIQYALAPTMPQLKLLFDRGQMAPLLNVGPLVAPLTRAMFEHSNTVAYPRPAKLFSHNDQQSTWQAFEPEGSATGWGGRLGDLAMSANTNAMFTTINATGNAVFLSGDRVVPFKVAQNGATVMYPVQSGNLYGSRAAGDALSQLLGTHHSHVFEQDYSHMNLRSIEYNSFINDALKDSSLNTSFNEDNSLAKQLEIVARLISSRGTLGVSRQVFMVSLGGFDHHTGLLGSHGTLLGQLDEALGAFQSAMVELNVSDRVTAFTASDFGRTLATNGDGSDHGWGGHHFIVGGAVNGGRFFGQAPHISISTDDQVGRGRLLPTTSVDQYVSTLALWLGVSPSDLPSIAPNIGRFSGADLGFMRVPSD